MTEISASLGARPRAGPPRNVSKSHGGVSTTFQSCQNPAMGPVSAAIRLSGLMDPANVSGPDFRPLHRLVPGARSHCQMGGRFFRWHMARLGEQISSRCARFGAASRFIPVCWRPEGTFPLQFSLVQCFGCPRAEIGEAPRIGLRWASLEGGRWTRPRKHSPAAAASSAADPPG